MRRKTFEKVLRNGRTGGVIGHLGGIAVAEGDTFKRDVEDLIDLLHCRMVLGSSSRGPGKVPEPRV